MDSVVSIDGSVRVEKLAELLGSRAEIDALDFKATCDLTKAKGKVEFVKDCAAMANLPRGGYLVIGAHDTGRPALDQPEISGNFDSARLQQLFDSYVSGTAQIISARHELEGREVVLVYVRPPTDHLPVVMKKDGAYTEQSGTQKTAFYEGQILTRFSSGNVKLDHRHWKRVLSNYETDLRKKVEKDSQELLKVVLDEIRQLATTGSGGSVPPALSVHLDDDSFYLAAVDLASSGVGGVERIRTIVRTLIAVGLVAGGTGDEDADGTVEDDRAQAFDRLCLLGLAGVDADSPELFGLVVEAYLEIHQRQFSLHEGRILGEVGEAAALRIVALLVRVFLLGSYITRRRKWQFLPWLVNRKITLSGGYEYSSWIRHALVTVSRAEVLKADGDGKGGSILAVARAHGRDTPSLCRDILAPVEVEASSGDPLLNSLCQFDLWWCMIAALHADHDKFGMEFYPNFAVFFGHRTEPAVDIIATDSAARAAAFPGSPRSDVASALKTVVEAARRESLNQGFHTEIKLSVSAAGFINGEDDSQA
ncbi:AlbA family DNA-binding domain-containing protein [Rhodococcus sp. A5(2022)]|uniref:AlbA family DNA-binding domain-containing protein n=1 Tax=Rhodococcus sp. A5(2022) TaxID=3003588 RepID=UPI0022A85C52|nr:ATP-binding protein [Rhodococcus sp. A5(2022)]MCZ1075622.1 ATP-binding protein [Rhodococcus sp. A5(2022)]